MHRTDRGSRDGEQTPEEETATRHARSRMKERLVRRMKLSPEGRCPAR